MEKVREFLESGWRVQKKRRYEFQINGREVDFSPAIPIPTSNLDFPVWLAKNCGVMKIARHQALPAIWESLKRQG